jgi:periplasmic protein TonB
MKSKTKKADLEGKKALFFQVGLIIALSFALLAFEWTTKGSPDFNLPTVNPLEVPIEIIPITKPEEIIPPKAPVIMAPEIIIIKPNDELIDDEDPDIFKEFEEFRLPDLLKPKQEEDVDETIPFMLIEEKPTFLGADYNAFSKWVAQNLRYPELAAQNGIQGKVTLEFLIDTDGSVKNVRLLRGVDPLLDAEALRVVNSSPRWAPGMQRGKPTKVLFTFPLTFRLN